MRNHIRRKGNGCLTEWVANGNTFLNRYNKNPTIYDQLVNLIYTEILTEETVENKKNDKLRVNLENEEKRFDTWAKASKIAIYEF